MTAQAAHDAAIAVLSEEATALSKVLRELNASDEIAVRTYNERIEARNREVEVSNRRADALNAAMAELQSAEADYMAECTARPFYRADEDALVKELGIKREQRNQSPAKPKPTSPSRPSTPGRVDA